MKLDSHSAATFLHGSLIPLKLEKISDAVEIRDEASGQSRKILSAFRAVGSVADAVYQSGRVIPQDVQVSALKDAVAKSRQMTMFVGHPGVETEEGLRHVGIPGNIAGHTVKYHFDGKQKHTVLDRVEILDTPKGEVAQRLIDSGLRLGISQRAIGRQEIKEFEPEGGEKQKVLMVTDLFGIFGWDLLLLDDANAGDVTETQTLSDSAIKSLMGTPDHQDHESRLWGVQINLADGSYEAVSVDAVEDVPESMVDEIIDEMPALTERELDEFAPLDDQVVEGEIKDRAVAKHNPAKADPSRPWNPSVAEINRLPNTAFGWLDEKFLSGKHRDRRKGRKLPHHLPDGRTVFRAVRAAMGVLNGARGGIAIPSGVRGAVYNHLAAHYRQFDLEPPALVSMEKLNQDARKRTLNADSASQNTEPTMSKKKTDAPGKGTESASAETPAEVVSVTDDSSSKVDPTIELGAKLVETNQELAGTITKMIGSMCDTLKAKFGEKEVTTDSKDDKVADGLADKLNAEEQEMVLSRRVYRTLSLASDEVDSIMSSDDSAETKNGRLNTLGGEMKEVFNDFTNAFISAHQNATTGSSTAATSEGAAEESTDSAAAAATPAKPTDAAPVVKDDSAAKPTDAVADSAVEYVPPVETPTAPIKNDETHTRITDSIGVSKLLTDSLQELVGVSKLRQAEEDLRKYAAEAISRQNLDDSASTAVQAIVNKTITSTSTKENIEDSIKEALDLMNSGRAKERLDAIGFENKGDGAMRVSDAQEVSSVGASHLSGVKLLTDQFSQSGKFRMAYPEAKDVPADLKAVMDKFDSYFAAELARETKRFDHLKDVDGKLVADVTQHADFETPVLLSRIVLFEVYAADLIRQITDFGVMENDRDSVPITRWRREEAGSTVASFRPSVLQRSNIKTGELASIPRGKLSTEFFNIDAEARKLQAVMSDEFLTRARRRPDVTGVAIAVKNLVDDIRRSIMQDIFFEQIRAGAAHGGSTFDVSDIDGDGTETVFQVIGTTPANAVSIVPNDSRTPLVVYVGTTDSDRTVVPEFGTSTVGGGPGNSFFYVVGHALSTVSFVDSTGAALPPASGTDNIRVTGTQADAEVRFDLTLPSITQEQHMNSLLFEVANQRAAMSSGGISNVGYYDADMVLASVVTSELMKQAAAYQTDGRRNGYAADAFIPEGNYGRTAGLAHWGSKSMVDDFIVIGDSNGVLFRQYEPTNLRGPIEARDSSGNLVGGKEWYAYQEDSIATPLIEKFAIITLYRS